MRNRAKPYLLAALPAVPYLIGVGLQVSGITNVPLSVAIFEVAAILAAAVAWALWSDWRATAFASPKGTLLAPLRHWSGLNTPRMGIIRTEMLAAFLVLVLSNAVIAGFISLAEQRSAAAAAGSAQRVRLMEFYDQISTMAYEQLPKPMTDAEYDKWDNQVNEKMDSIQEWVRANMGQGAMFRLVDSHNLRFANFTHAVNQKHNSKIITLLSMQSNLRDMIETSIWDKK
jgi:hypothetical protein